MALLETIKTGAEALGFDVNTGTDKSYLSYDRLLQDRRAFRNIYRNHKRQSLDEPGTFFFKIFFYFNNEQAEEGLGSNLLGIKGNTAYNYLTINNEKERASYLKEFINLLSDISSESPWYFQSIEGIDVSQERGYLKEFKVEDTPKQISIKCLQEAIDMRVTMLLELYRSACFSHIWKKEIVPVNLRKFDMGIYIFRTPMNGDTAEKKRIPENGKVERNTETLYENQEFISSKYIEFHNCEISLESLKSCYGSPDNTKGFAIEPVIIINYDECYTSSFNEWTCRTIGDLVKLDLDRKSTYSESDPRFDKEEAGFLDRLVSRTVTNLKGRAMREVKRLVKRAALGNVYKLSLAGLMRDAGRLIEKGGDGDLVDLTQKTVKHLDKGKNVVSDIKNKLEKPEDKKNIKNLGNVSRSYRRNL